MHFKSLLTRVLFVGILLMAASPACFAKKLIAALPSVSNGVGTFSIDSLRNSLATMPLHHIEGLWRFTTDGAEIAIVRDQDSETASGQSARAYRILLIHSPNRALRPGTLMGLISPSAKRGAYEARIYTRNTGSKLHSPRNFLLTLDNEESRLVFDMKKSAFSVNLWRLLPYMWRYSVHRNTDSKHPVGCIRIFPEPELPVEPRYL